MVSAVVAIVVLLLLAGSTVYIVPQQGAYIIERLGRFHKVSKAGIHVKIPFIDAIASKTNLRVSQLDVTLETKTLDNVFVTIKLALSSGYCLMMWLLLIMSCKTRVLR